MYYIKINSRRYYIISFMIIILVGAAVYIFTKLRSSADEIIPPNHLPSVEYNINQ